MNVRVGNFTLGVIKRYFIKLTYSYGAKSDLYHRKPVLNIVSPMITTSVCRSCCLNKTEVFMPIFLEVINASLLGNCLVLFTSAMINAHGQVFLFLVDKICYLDRYYSHTRQMNLTYFI